MDPSASTTKATFPMLFTAFGAYIGGPLIYGYNIGCLNVPAKYVKMFIKTSVKAHYGVVDDAKDTVTTMMFSIVILLFAAGGAIGAGASGSISDKVGRKRAVLLTLILTLIGSMFGTISKMSNSIELLMLARFVIGVGAGACFSCVPLYVCEIVPRNLRGAAGSGSQLFITLGILIGTAFTLEDTLGSELLWPVGLGAQSFFCMISAVMLLSPIAQESPKWLLVVQRDPEGAKATFTRLYKTANVGHLISEVREEMEGGVKGEKASLFQFLKSDETRWPIILVICLNVCQQLSGINVVFFFAGSLYEKAGLAGKEISYAALVVSTINVIATIICVYLMDRLGRRKLLLPPMLLLCLSIVAQIALLLMSKSQPENKALAWGTILMVIVFVICFAVGLAPIPGFIASELFRSEQRATAQGIGGTANLLATLAVALMFENVLLRFLGELSFLPFLIAASVGLVLFFIKLPETKDRDVADIYKDPRLTGCRFCA